MTNTQPACLCSWKLWQFASGFVENLLLKKWSLQITSATFKTPDQSLISVQADCLFHWNCTSNLQIQMSSAAFRWCNTGEWSYEKCSSDEALPQLSCQMLKMGSSDHRSSTLGVCAWKLVQANDLRVHWGRPDVIRPLSWGWPPPLWLTGDAWLPLYQQDIIKRDYWGNLCDPIVALSFPLKGGLY